MISEDHGGKQMTKNKRWYQKKSLWEKLARNAEYLAMIDRGIAQLEAGKGQQHELIEVSVDDYLINSNFPLNFVCKIIL